MVDVVKEPFDVNIYHPRIFDTIVLALLNCVMRTSARSVTK